MDPFLAAIVARMFERVLGVAAGVLAIYLGYRLFLKMPDNEKGSGKVVLPGGISIYLSRVGPGIFFSLFGAVVIGLSFHYSIKYDGGGRFTGTEIVSTAGSGGSFSGIAPSAGAPASLSTLRERNAALIAITALNRAASELRADLPAYERRRIIDGIHEAKLRMMKSVWDAEHWGAYDDVAAWLQDHGAGEPPQQLAEAVRQFRAGSAERPE